MVHTLCVNIDWVASMPALAKTAFFQFTRLASCHSGPSLVTLQVRFLCTVVLPNIECLAAP